MFSFSLSAFSVVLLATLIHGLWIGEQDSDSIRLIDSSESLLASNPYSGGNEDSVPRKSRPSVENKRPPPSKGRSNRTNIIRRPSVKRIVRPSLHAAWDEYNHLCVLAKFQATFTIKYETRSGTAQLIDKMPQNARSRGRCDQFDEEPVLDVMWKDSQLAGFTQKTNSTGGFTFRIIFQKFPDEARWGVQQMQLLYNTGHPVFRGSANARKVIVRSNKDDYRLQFHTKLVSSILCPSPPPIQMYDSDGTLRVIARLSNMQLQAFEFNEPSEANFDRFMRCEQVSFGSGVAHPLTNVRNDSLTFTVGVMTVCIATLTVVGYAIYRSHIVGSEKYKNII